MHFETIIRNGTVVDGSGKEPFVADVAIHQGRIAAVGRIEAQADEEIDAGGKLVTPGFVDIHTHYDGQITWEQRMRPSSDHGVTTVVMGNCGVGFAPCRPDQRGCLLVTTAIELGRSDPQVAELLDTYYARIESAFAGLIRRGQETGAIRGDLDPLVMARWLRVTGQGLSVSSRIGLVPGDLADVVRMALSPPNDQANNQEGERG